MRRGALCEAGSIHFHHLLRFVLDRNTSATQLLNINGCPEEKKLVATREAYRIAGIDGLRDILASGALSVVGQWNVLGRGSGWGGVVSGTY